MAQPQAPGCIAGYLTIQLTEGDGMVGGYLLINASGRPLEFHCTLPVVPDRATRILHGQSLRNTLITNCIGPALLSRSRMAPHILLTDSIDCVRLSDQADFPVAYVGRGEDSVAEGWISAGHGDCLAAMPHPGYGAESQLEQLLDSLDPNLQLDEPFSRIREALQEAGSQAKAA